MDTVDLLGKYGLIPVVIIDEIESAVPTAEALKAGGLPVMEVTLRTSAGLEAIQNIHALYPDFTLGAGTVLTVEQCEAALSAGASYIVSPGLREEIVRLCQSRNVPVIPGCVTPSEIEKGLSYGLKVLKFFPASTYGGAAGCKALYGPYASTGVRFVPTGGITLDNLSDYVDKPFIHAVGGGWLADKKTIQAGDYDRITLNARQAIDKMLGFELIHIGINMPDRHTAELAGDKLAKAFGFEKKPGTSSVFAGKNIELLEYMGPGAMGHIAIRTNSIGRAIFYLGNRGFSIDESTIRTKNGQVNFVYLKDEIGGFAIHLLQK